MLFELLVLAVLVIIVLVAINTGGAKKNGIDTNPADPTDPTDPDDKPSDK